MPLFTGFLRMIRLSLVLLVATPVAFVFLRCSKSTHQDPVPDLSTQFQFTANGTIYHWNGNKEELKSYGSIIGCNGASCSLTAEPENGGLYQLIAFNIHTQSLSETSYNYTPAVATTWNLGNDICGLPAPNNNVMYSDFEMGDFATITISKLHDGYADGTFLAAFSASDRSAKLNITDGTFKNVKIVK
jgi:hypothetical protein